MNLNQCLSRVGICYHWTSCLYSRYRKHTFPDFTSSSYPSLCNIPCLHQSHSRTHSKDTLLTGSPTCSWPRNDTLRPHTCDADQRSLYCWNRCPNTSNIRPLIH